MLFHNLDEIKAIYIGLAPYRQLYKDMELMWQMGYPVLYDGGYVEDVGWSGNRLPHKDFYNPNVCKAYFDHAEAEAGGYMHMTINGTYNLQYNNHICGDKAYAVPYNATKMKVEVEKGVNALYCRFGLMPEDCTNSLDTSNGGVLSESIHMGTSGRHIYELELPEGFAGNEWVPVVNMFLTPSGYYELKIHKIWFE